MEKKLTGGQALEGRLRYKKKNVWEHLSRAEREAALELGEEYKEYLSQVKTEREAVRFMVSRAEAEGFRPLDELKHLKPGQRFYLTYRSKVLLLGVAGERPLKEGLRLVGAHIDAPRLDLKPQPLYESDGLALFKTHYYGGIKKYQWPALPLALHGLVMKAGGEALELVLGEAEEDPVFTVTDLLPHLAKDQMEKKMKEGIQGEDLNVLVGSLPYADEEVQEKVKLAVLQHLHERYGLVEEDLVSAELELVPAGKARDVGLDRSLVGGYGQDDRACAFTAFKAILQVQKPRYTALALFVDKEEIGSTGNTGAQSRLLEYFVARLGELTGDKTVKDVWQVFDRSLAVSGDTVAALDPSWPNVLDKYNAPVLGHGVVLLKYSGAGGKYDTNDAHAETVYSLRRLFNEHGIIWQTGELGKVDQGGGGTIAQFLAQTGMDVIDCGPALLSIHSPFEIASKGDIYMTFRAYQVFLQN
ncbi:MAG TPA: aminopeptidase [Clostridia bacterium]|nr:aminopeptidase [Clostridia bacterium]